MIFEMYTPENCQPLEASFSLNFVICLLYVYIVNQSKQTIHHIDLKI